MSFLGLHNPFHHTEQKEQSMVANLPTTQEMMHEAGDTPATIHAEAATITSEEATKIGGDVVALAGKEDTEAEVAAFEAQANEVALPSAEEAQAVEAQEDAAMTPATPAENTESPQDQNQNPAA